MRRTTIIVIIIAFMVSILPSIALGNTECSKVSVLEGAIYTKNAKMELELVEKIYNVSVSKTENSIEGDFALGKNVASFNADYIDVKEGVYSYNGKFRYNGDIYNCDILENEKGMSILFYNDSKEYIRTIILSYDKIDTEIIADTINKEVVQKILENKVKVEITEETLLNSNDGGVKSGPPVTRTIHMFKDSITIPFIISGGTVDGTLTYITNIDQISRFYAVDILGYVSWASGFDGFSITNTNEMYGNFYGTPGCPSKLYHSFSIARTASKSGAYYFKAVVSYSLLVDVFPVFFWSTDSTYMYTW